MTEKAFYGSIKKTLMSESFKIYDEVLERDRLQGDIDSKMFSSEHVSLNLIPTIQQHNIKIDKMKEAAHQLIDEMFDEYLQEYKHSLALNGSDLTEDSELLKLDYLNLNDLEAIAERNKDNNTMIALVNRYARAHGIETDTLPMENEKSIIVKNANDVRAVSHNYIDRWIDDPVRSGRMLDSYFEAVL